MKPHTLAVFTISYFIYLSIGATVFSAFEKPVEEQACYDAHEFLKSLVNLSTAKLELSEITYYAQVRVFWMWVYPYVNDTKSSIKGKNRCELFWNVEQNWCFLFQMYIFNAKLDSLIKKKLHALSKAYWFKNILEILLTCFVYNFHHFDIISRSEW